ncbi:uncharacterized protein LOC131323767 [Rhododendron vialii]|uniref:uncharacterized protein LOC131323767 n=1 Tax=Rhododendron vialii TaxID=182163 RepID=UPI00265D8B29|nr:uncharacterized protein LOC131323767 [Rhododendron vialii]
MAKQLEDLKFKQVHQVSEVKVEEVCALRECLGHLVTTCPAFPMVKEAYQSNQAEVNAINQCWDPYSNTYNPGSGKVIDKDLPPKQKSVPPSVPVAAPAVVPDLGSVPEEEKEAESPEVVVPAHAAPMTPTPPFPISLMEAIDTISQFAKVLKDLYMSKQRTKSQDKVNVFNVDSRVEDDEEVYEVSLIDTLVQEHVNSVMYKDPLEIALTAEEASFLDSPELPKPELKPLPDTLKYAFLKGDDTFPVVISSSLEVDQEAKLLALLKKHVGAIGWTIADLQGISPTVCTHRIFLDEDVKPSRQPQRRLNPNMKEVVQAEVLKLLYAGIIYPIAHSEWVSPVQVVPKKAGVTVVRNDEGELVSTRVQTGWRVCINYRKLNSSTRKDHFPLPFIDQILERVVGRAFYCFLDGYSGYNQIEVVMEDQEKTTFTCPYGTFAYRRMQFGLCNAPRTFSRCMMGIFSDMVEKIVEVFMNDFSVFGDSFDEYLRNLGKVLQQCEEKQLVLNWEKCHFMVTQGIVLGHIVSSKGIEVDKAKIDLIANLPIPKSVKDIRSFLGHANFYRHFIKGFSTISRLLCHLLLKDMPFVWSEACEGAFQTLKRSLTTPPIMQPPDWSLPFELMCDASDYAVEVILGQRRGKDPCVVHYVSKTLNEAQMNYTTTEKELLAVVFALDKFWSYLKGVENVVANHLSRLEFEDPTSYLPIVDTFPNEQLFAANMCPWFANIANYLVTRQIPPHWSTTEKQRFFREVRQYIYDDPYVFKYCADQIMRWCVPKADQRGILEFCHTEACGGHFSAKKTAT